MWIPRIAKPFLIPLSFSFPAIVSLAFGVGIAVAVLGLVQPEELWPLKLSSLLGYEVVVDVDLGIVGGPNLTASQDLQARGMGLFFVVLSSVALAAVAVALVNLIILLKNRAAAQAQADAIRAALGAVGWRVTVGRVLGFFILAGLAVALGSGFGLAGGAGIRALWPFEQEGAWTTVYLPVTVGIVSAFLAVATIFAAKGHPRGATESGVRQLLSGGGRLKGLRFPEGLRSLLPALQIGLSLTLLMGSGVLIDALRDSGSRPTVPDRLEGLVRLPVEAQTEMDIRPVVWEELLADLRSDDRIEAAAFFSVGAWVGLGRTDGIWTECGDCVIGGMWVPFSSPFIRHHVVSADSFSAMGIRILEGREIGASDGPGAPLVAVVNETYAKRYFDSNGPVGKSLGIGRDKDAWHEVVGIVEDFGIKGIGSSQTPMAAVFLSAAQHSPTAGDLLLRTRPGGSEIAKGSAPLLGASSGFTAMSDPELLSTYLESSLAPFEWFGTVTLILGLLTLVLASYGVFAILEYSVTLRTEEIGVRRALGGGWVAILGLLLRRCGVILALGLFLGLEGSLFLTAGLEAVAFEGQLFDARRFLTLASLMTVVAAAGTLRPTVEALTIPPREGMGGM